MAPTLQGCDGHVSLLHKEASEPWHLRSQRDRTEATFRSKLAKSLGLFYTRSSVMSDPLRPRGPYPARLLCPWGFPGQNTGIGCHFLLLGIFPAQGPNSWQADSLPLSHLGRKPVYLKTRCNRPSLEAPVHPAVLGPLLRTDAHQGGSLGRPSSSSAWHLPPC